jgi:hypothetical protein
MRTGVWSAGENREADLNAQKAAESEERARAARDRFFEQLAAGGTIPGLCWHGQRTCGACLPKA